MARARPESRVMNPETDTFKPYGSHHLAKTDVEKATQQMFHTSYLEV